MRTILFTCNFPQVAQSNFINMNIHLLGPPGKSAFGCIIPRSEAWELRCRELTGHHGSEGGAEAKRKWTHSGSLCQHFEYLFYKHVYCSQMIMLANDFSARLCSQLSTLHILSHLFPSFHR